MVTDDVGSFVRHFSRDIPCSTPWYWQWFGQCGHCYFWCSCTVFLSLSFLRTVLNLSVGTSHRSVHGPLHVCSCVHIRHTLYFLGIFGVVSSLRTQG